MQDMHIADAAAGAMRAPSRGGNALLARLLVLSIGLHVAVLLLVPSPASSDVDAAPSVLDVVLVQAPLSLPVVRPARTPPQPKTRLERIPPQPASAVARVEPEPVAHPPVLAQAVEAVSTAPAYAVSQTNAEVKSAGGGNADSAHSVLTAASGRDVVAMTAPSFYAAYLHNTPPQYPMIARRNGEQGTVRVRVLVTLDGHPGRVQLDQSSGSAALDQAALDTVNGWRFVPARRGNDAIESWVIVPIVFRLENA